MLLDKDKLQDKLLEVIEAFPWYKGLIGGERANYSLETLPLMTSTTLDTYYYNQPFDPSLTVYLTSGTSTGRRKAILYSKEDDKHYIDIKTKLYGDLIAGSGCVSALADMGTGHAANTALSIFERLGLEHHSIPSNCRSSSILNSFKPSSLTYSTQCLPSLIISYMLLEIRGLLESERLFWLGKSPH